MKNGIRTGRKVPQSSLSENTFQKSSTYPGPGGTSFLGGEYPGKSENADFVIENNSGSLV